MLDERSFQKIPLSKLENDKTIKNILSKFGDKRCCVYSGVLGRFYSFEIKSGTWTYVDSISDAVFKKMSEWFEETRNGTDLSLVYYVLKKK